MGYYINNDSKGNHIGTTFYSKIENLVEDGAEVIPTPIQWEEDLCCAVDNGIFGAVAYAYDKQEMEVFLNEKNRPTKWLKIANAKHLSGYLKDESK